MSLQGPDHSLSHDQASPFPHPSARTLDPPDISLHLRRLIEQTVSRVFGVATTDLLRPSRGRKSIALARQVAMYLARVVGGLRLSEIGRVFGRDCSTVRHACMVIENRRDDPGFNLTLDHLETIIKRLCLQMLPAHAPSHLLPVA